MPFISHRGYYFIKRTPIEDEVTPFMPHRGKHYPTGSCLGAVFRLGSAPASRFSCSSLDLNLR